MSLWRTFLDTNREEAEHWIASMSSAGTPREFDQRVLQAIDQDRQQEIKSLVSEFNNISPHRLPIAHMSLYRSHPTYNKYGIAQDRMMSIRPLFPDAFYEMLWGEVELLVKIVALLTIDQQH